VGVLARFGANKFVLAVLVVVASATGVLETVIVGVEG
jgi:hypothetical protein